MPNASNIPESSVSGNASPHLYQVSELARALRETVEAAYEDVWVEGEVSNFRRPASGHCYFTLKDAEARLRAVLWRRFTPALRFLPRDGMLVRVRGHLSLYEQRGTLELMAESIELAGAGALQQAFEDLKRRLEAEGLFEARHKRPLPPFPEAVGLITSGTGAALHDMLSILERRFPQVRVLVCPVQVQGLGAAEAIAEAITAFDALPPGDPLRPDVLIIGRGGGSAEDLWAFNEEVVVRAVFAATLPIVSAVGHETDVAISDFVADVRAATPSMAAELVVPDRRDVALLVRGYHAQMREVLEERLSRARLHIQHLAASHAFNRPRDRLHHQQAYLQSLTDRLHRAARQHVAGQRQRLGNLDQRLHLLDPARPLTRGYARVEAEGNRIRQAADLAPGGEVTLHFQDGHRRARILD